jgi:hypothetical protein
MAVIDPGARLKGSQKVHSWLFAQRKSKNVIFVFLTDQRLTLTVIDPGAPPGARYRARYRWKGIPLLAYESVKKSNGFIDKVCLKMIHFCGEK